MLAVKWNKQGTDFFGWNLPEWFAFGLALFLVLFPKGGFKAGPIPLTWGYAIVGITLCVGVPLWLFRGASNPTVTRAGLGVFLILSPLQLLFVYSLVVNGIDDPGFAIADIVNFFVLPFAFLAIFPQFLPRIRKESFLSAVRAMVFIAAAYGIFLFIWRIATGKYIEIPFLTVNVGDVGTLDDKFNSRPGGIFKLISTYNNGNQYGVATLLLLPLVDVAEGRRFQKLVIRAALILTLSRTVWVGLVLNEALDALRHFGGDLLAKPGLSVRFSSLTRIGRLGLAAVAVLGMTLVFSGVSFLFDPTLGGRSEYLTVLSPITVLPGQPVGNFAEVIYYSALWMLGVSGLCALLLVFFSPLLFLAIFPEMRRHDPVQIAALSGLLLYIGLAAMDGALNYIPTMAFYWFLWMLFLYGGRFKENGNLETMTAEFA